MAMNVSESLNIREDEVQLQVPSTPRLKTIGYGTGVHVYHWDRSSKSEANCSPWALKKPIRQCNRVTVPKRLEDEANILKKLNHPNIVGFRGYKKTEEGRPILAMEQCGTSLGDAIENRRENYIGPYEPEIICKVILAISKALHYLHCERKIIHGDVKSYNVLIKGDFEQIKLCDFGVSFPIDDNGYVENYVGTLCWNAPEVIENDYKNQSPKPITAKADIFALGLTIWEMLSLCPPFSNQTETSMNESFSNLNESYSDCGSEIPYGTRPNLPYDLREVYKDVIAIFEWCTEFDPSNRPNALDIIKKLQS